MSNPIESLKRYEFKRVIENLEGKKGQATELITIYIPPDKQISDVVSQLKDEYGQASNIKSKSTRTNVQSALSSIMSRLKYYRFPPSNGLVIFTGTIALGGDKSTMETLVVEPIEPIKSYQYRCDSTFNLEPLKEMLKEKQVFGLVVVDRNEATVGVLNGKRIEPVKHLTSGVPGKHTKGGQSQRRFERLRLIAIHEFFKRIGEAANNEFLQHPELKGVLIGGPSPTKEEFIDGEYLHHELQQKILGAFDASYTDEFGLSELVENGAEVLQELDLIREKNVVEHFLQELVRDSNKATYGEKQVRKALQLGAVDTLLLSEALR
ncbi:MAG: peptide chain release factor aRF-1, partial [Halobacteriota archaeon]